MSLLFPIVLGLIFTNVILNIVARNWTAVIGWTCAAMFAIPLMFR